MALKYVADSIIRKCNRIMNSWGLPRSVKAFMDGLVINPFANFVALFLHEGDLFLVCHREAEEMEANLQNLQNSHF